MSDLDFNQQELNKTRADTPGCSGIVHFNNAGASLMPSTVSDAVIDYLKQESQYGGYETAEKFAAQIQDTYKRLGRYLNCDSSEIALTDNATTAWQRAFLSVPFESGDTILTTSTEYASNYIPFLQLKKKLSVDIRTIPNDRYGQVDLAAMEDLMDDKVKLISVTHVPTNGGLVNPVEEIGAIAKARGTWYLLDACQSVGQMPIDVKAIGCDFLSATSRKFLRGPRGVGFLYASAKSTSHLEPMILDLHGAQWESRFSYTFRNDARKYENWELNLAGVIGLGKAVAYLMDIGIEKIWHRIRYLSDYLRARLSSIEKIQVQDLGVVKCGIVSFSGSFDAAYLKSRLQQIGINVSVLHREHTLFDMQERNLGPMIRASVHYFNTIDEIDHLVDQIALIMSE
jgi:selenocysteine lyase/cysteine desulfurase